MKVCSTTCIHIVPRCFIEALLKLIRTCIFSTFPFYDWGLDYLILQTYSNCSCIPHDVMAYLPQKKDEIVLKTGACRSNCYYNFVLFIGITMVMHCLGSSGKIGNVLVNYRYLTLHPVHN